MRTPACSLILSTYNLPRHLELVLTSLERQSFKDFEIIIADDGSNDETKNIIQHFYQNKRLQINHMWQENKGFRKCKILNKALGKASSQYLVFLDGDCIPHVDFIKDHYENREDGYFLAGRRVELGEAMSNSLTVHDIKNGLLDTPSLRLFISTFKKGDIDPTTHFNRSLRIANPFLRKLFKMTKIDDLKGCNYSVHKIALIEINGFDEDYEGYGREDTDIEIRLKNLGLKIKSLKGLALQYHVWHPRRGFTPANDQKLNDVIQNKIIKCKNGLSKI